MGRASGGRSGGSSRSSGGHSSRSSGSSRSSRPSRSSGSTKSTSSADRRRNDPADGRQAPPPRSGGRRQAGGGGGCCLAAIFRPFIIIGMIVVVMIAAFLVTDRKDSGTDTDSADNAYEETYASYGYERLASSLEFDADCVTDELGWIEDAQETAEELEYFFDLTGVQPYIYLAAYSAELASEDDMLSYAETWYDQNIDNEYTLLYFYFAEENADEEIGYMCYVAGTEAAGIFNEDTMDVFWDYIDYYWDTELETGSMFAAAFCDTADALME